MENGETARALPSIVSPASVVTVMSSSRETSPARSVNVCSRRSSVRRSRGGQALRRPGRAAGRSAVSLSAGGVGGTDPRARPTRSPTGPVAPRPGPQSVALQLVRNRRPPAPDCRTVPVPRPRPVARPRRRRTRQRQPPHHRASRERTSLGSKPVTPCRPPVAAPTSRPIPDHEEGAPGLGSARARSQEPVQPAAFAGRRGACPPLVRGRRAVRDSPALQIRVVDAARLERTRDFSRAPTGPRWVGVLDDARRAAAHPSFLPSRSGGVGRATCCFHRNF